MTTALLVLWVIAITGAMCYSLYVGFRRSLWSWNAAKPALWTTFGFFVIEILTIVCVSYFR